MADFAIPPERQAGSYPARSRRQAMIADLAEAAGVWIAGRLLRSPAGALFLRDASGSVPLAFDAPGLTLPARSEERRAPGVLSAGDLVDLRGALRGRTFHVAKARLLAPGRQAPPAGSPNARLWSAGAEPFVLKNRVRAAVRGFFAARGFLEVETPVLVPAAGQEPHLSPFRTTVETRAGAREAFLITSPEYAHKRILAAGCERIFEIARAFRNGSEEGCGAHWYEFSMLEWYRAYASYLEIMEDVEQLTAAVAREIDSPVLDRLTPPFRRLPLREAFREHAGVDLAPYLTGDAGEFARRDAASGRFGLSQEDSPDARFFKIFVSAIEPGLRGMGAVFLVDYPASQAALSKIKADDPTVAERFELYLDGVELANGFTELNDAAEQRRRFETEARARAAMGSDPVPFDEAFLEALELGVPPAGGVALGLDRLAAVLRGSADLDVVLPFGRFSK